MNSTSYLYSTLTDTNTLSKVATHVCGVKQEHDTASVMVQILTVIGIAIGKQVIYLFVYKQCEETILTYRQLLLSENGVDFIGFNSARNNVILENACQIIQSAFPSIK